MTEQPGAFDAWDRLAELALMAGQKSVAENYRGKKAEFNDVRQKYKKLLDRDDRVEHAGELALLADQLGRRIEARGWTLIAEGHAKTERLRSGSDGMPVSGQSSETLATLIVDAGHPSASEASPVHSTPNVLSPEFRDDADVAGLRFVHDNGHSRRNPPPPEAMCGGVAILDYDGDGWFDVYVVQGGAFPGREPAKKQGDRLFRNRGDGTFEDVTERTRIASFPGGLRPRGRRGRLRQRRPARPVRHSLAKLCTLP